VTEQLKPQVAHKIEIRDREGRPHRLCDGQPIATLFA